MKLLYLGNKLSEFKTMSSAMETLIPLFREFADVYSASGKKNQMFRFLDMLYSFAKHGLRSDYIVIDVYSSRAFYFAFFFGCLANIFEKKAILVLRGGDLPKLYKKSPKKLRFLFLVAFKIVAPSSYLADFFRRRGFQVEVIPNMIVLEDYPYSLRLPIRPRILALRGFGKVYNPLMTLKTILMIKEKVPGLELLMLGNEDEYYYDEVLEFIRYHELESIVKVRAKMSKKDWVTLSMDYDIMISNPIIDNTPISLIEGMALGMNVISTNVGGVPFLVSKEEAVLVERDDIQGLGRGLLKLMSDCSYSKQLSESGRIKAENFDWSIVSKEWKYILK